MAMSTILSMMFTLPQSAGRQVKRMGSISVITSIRRRLSSPEEPGTTPETVVPSSPGGPADDQYPCRPSLLSRALMWKGEGERAIGIAQGDWRAVGGSGRLFIVSTQVTMNLNRYTVHGMMAVGGRR